ncbi:hypothetical protein [Kitasatospora sp. NPDC094016]|uniref:hypothetical protein n=1 Tax=unclassified Kitasatospora TaxID=2633591 RepID=UPI00332CCDBE
MGDALVEHVPVEGELELRTVVRAVGLDGAAEGHAVVRRVIAALLGRARPRLGDGGPVGTGAVI